ncbi:hypothetical protein HYH03_012529 [Edaphochlamys debaryana]|uniref:Uncharacterized protein n=1 Tax=Edaphochlamys debaryana TaxID=47281 RepID=A0A835Y0F2_9CHLO|nr:hypothetical protein HYH03_012529 [Edaphochlamys debaryana]|eukprot:KAG2488899.1 hypothetical protein HYH03_012529 [Edaphochlamys debaryana]
MMPLPDCLAWTLEARGTNLSPACAARVDSPCFSGAQQDLRSSSLSLEAFEGSQPACDRVCFEWAAAQQDGQQSALVNADASSNCSPALNILTGSFGVSLQSILQAQVAAKQLDQRVVDAFAADMDSFKLERCEAGTSADGKFHHVLITMCGRLSARGEAEALSPALQYNDGTLATWQAAALAMTGFTASSSSATCSNLAFEAAFSSDYSRDKDGCAGLRTAWSANSCPTDVLRLGIDDQEISR